MSHCSTTYHNVQQHTITCTTMYNNVPQCTTTYNNNLQFTTKYHNVPRYTITYHIVSKTYHNVEQSVQQRTTPYHNLYKKVPQCITMLNKWQQCSITYHNVYNKIPQHAKKSTMNYVPDNERIIKNNNKNFRLLGDHVTCIVFSRTLFTHEPFPIITARDKMLCLNQNEKIKLTWYNSWKTD